MDPATAVGLSVWHVILLFGMVIGGACGILWKAVLENRADIKRIKEERTLSLERLAKAETKVKVMEDDHKGFNDKFEKLNEKMDTLLQRLADVQAFMKQGN